MLTKFIREIKISPAYDKRDPNPKKNYGIGSCRIFFIVIGPKGAITINFGTNWYLSTTIIEYKTKGINHRIIDLEKESEPLKAWSWDYHSKTPRYDGQHSLTNCDFLACYCDGSGLKAERYTEILLNGGSDKLFEELEKDYIITFGGEENGS
jgi:hypothetical protein